MTNNDFWLHKLTRMDNIPADVQSQIVGQAPVGRLPALYLIHQMYQCHNTQILNRKWCQTPGVVTTSSSGEIWKLSWQIHWLTHHKQRLKASTNKKARKASAEYNIQWKKYISLSVTQLSQSCAHPRRITGVNPTCHPVLAKLSTW